jgi:hypothetical protein
MGAHPGALPKNPIVAETRTGRMKKGLFDVKVILMVIFMIILYFITHQYGGMEWQIVDPSALFGQII